VNVFIVSASGGQKPQFWANFDIWGLPHQPPFADEDQIWCAVMFRCFCTICHLCVVKFS